MKWVGIAVIVVIVLLAALKVSAPTAPNETIAPTGGNGQTEVKSNVDNSQPKGTSLDLSGQHLSKVPMSVFSRTDLTSLDLSNDQLTGALQAEVRHLSHLKVLNLSNNQFTGVPAEIGQLSQLEDLDLSNNQLTGLPHELGNLKNLKRLDLRGNQPSKFDLNIIKKSLPNTTILVD